MKEETHKKLQQAGTVLGIGGTLFGIAFTGYQWMCLAKDRKELSRQVCEEEKSKNN